ncbi:very short patch repair endonuclease [Hoeflea sp. 108]|jgi:DNA mismatch endonuclease (patch repair protein)|uniref:very short patch repair endonuclease n=1 Tax=Hoeflea sp. 108 TaxID=1116369 RepID=UPI000382BA5B|nr:very short patch repair endonuclease [Hoeflea sp. 108]
MADHLTATQRSAQMARIRRANTRPERIVRGLLHSLGYRFRIQLKGVPGRPDVAFPGRRKAIFIHGCFWHGHAHCTAWRLPKTRTEFWDNKIQTNRMRDERLLAAAMTAGWACLVIWECEMKDQRILANRLADFLGPTRFQRRENTP